MFAVPYQRYVDAVAALTTPATTTALRNVIFVHSTGRCGSTLLSKLLGGSMHADDREALWVVHDGLLTPSTCLSRCEPRGQVLGRA